MEAPAQTSAHAGTTGAETLPNQAATNGSEKEGEARQPSIEDAHPEVKDTEYQGETMGRLQTFIVILSICVSADDLTLFPQILTTVSI